MKTRIIAKVIVIAQDTGRILVEKRVSKPGKANAGKWDSLGGNAEEGETIEQTATREVYEESGVHLDKLEFLESYPVQGKEFLKTAHYFIAIVPHEETTVCSEESQEVSWHTYEKLLTMDLTDHLHQMLTKYKSLIEREKRPHK